MIFTEHTKIGYIWASPVSKLIELSNRFVSYTTSLETSDT
ncbi:hypothetical protein F4694_001153 [Bacillus niacini]|uniref:Uncharacterized protein n=1 Tax=Neobacillus niacini TaxID=86668 RepID=A0A852T959_9BACI|nr:hypothetical protein [Neobacillus niacini]